MIKIRSGRQKLDPRLVRVDDNNDDNALTERLVLMATARRRALKRENNLGISVQNLQRRRMKDWAIGEITLDKRTRRAEAGEAQRRIRRP